MTLFGIYPFRFGFIVCIATFLAGCGGTFESTLQSEQENSSNSGFATFETQETETGITVTVQGDLIRYVDFYLDDELSPRLHETVSPFEFTQNYAELAEGSHSLRVVVAIDVLGDVSTVTRYIPFTNASPSEPGDGEDGSGGSDDGNSGDSEVTQVIEAENFEVISNFQVKSSSGASGGRVISVPSSVSNSNEASVDARYRFSVSESGTYHLYARVFAPGLNADAFYLGLNGDLKRVYPSETAKFSWIILSGNLNSGMNDISIGHGESGLEIDLLVVSNKELNVMEIESSIDVTPVVEEPTVPPVTMPSPESACNDLNDFQLPAATIYVSPSGSDSNSGRSMSSPFRTVSKAASVVQPGDVVYLRGGIYPINTKFRIPGTSQNPIVWSSYPGETAIFDGSDQDPATSNHRVWIQGASWNVFSNLEVRNSPSIGIYVVNSNNVLLHNIESHGNDGSGIQNYSGNNNRFQYILTHNNYDRFHPEGEDGQDADGIGISSGDSNVLYRVVAFNNSDDGIDTWKSTNTLVDEAVVFSNGRGTYGNGNGIKAGGGIDNYTTVRNSIAYNNKSVGITNNSGRKITFLNNTSFNNGYSFVAGPEVTLRNNIGVGGRMSLGQSSQNSNSWNLGISSVGFVSSDPQNDNYLSLSSNSPAREAGVDVGLPYSGSRPDLGALSYGSTLSSISCY